MSAGGAAPTVQVLGPGGPAAERVLTPGALAFLGRLHRELEPSRRALLAERQRRQQRFDQGELPDFLAETAAIRADLGWSVPPAPVDLCDRRVEITGPTDRKMMINALNSGAQTYMADLEDSNSPTWLNCLQGQANLIDAADRTIAIEDRERSYRLQEKTATLLVRPRGWHLPEKHLEVDGSPISASLFDFGLFIYHCAGTLLARGSGPYLYLPKLEGHREAALWNDACRLAEEELELPRGCIRTTVLIETILAAFEMEEILYQLRERVTGLNAGRWDYMFSIIKKFREREDFVLPDRSRVTMTAPFMRAYTDLLVSTCHRRGAHAIGGMAAFIPNRHDPELNQLALAKVREDKRREAGDGFDGSWVAHPDLVPVALKVFEQAMAGRPNQLSVQREVQVRAADLLDIAATEGEITPAGAHQNLRIGILYIASWLQGVGAAAIDNLMEDAATAEISRSQIWQWLRHQRLDRGQIERQEREILSELGPGYQEAGRIFHQVALSQEFVEFLTLPGYQLLE